MGWIARLFGKDPIVRRTVVKKNHYHPDPEAYVLEPDSVGGKIINVRVPLTQRDEQDTYSFDIKGFRKSGDRGEGTVIVSEFDFNNLNEGDYWICAKSPQQ
jgi:hypothetical protein